MQLSLLDVFQSRKRFDVLRQEVRLNNRRKIGQVFKLIGKSADITFENVFDSERSKSVLLYYLNEIESRRPAILDAKAVGPKELLADLIVNNPEVGMNKVLRLFGIKLAIDSVNMRELREMFGKCSPKTWYRFVEDVNSIQLPVQNSPFAMIRNNLNDYDPLKLVDFFPNMLNNDKEEK